MVKKRCSYCGKKFQTYKSTIKKGGGKYCSRSCYLKSLKTKKPHNFQNNNHVCLWCGRKFHVPLNRERDGRGKYCSKKCLKLAKDSTITRICKGCGKKFSFPKWQDKTCCSLSCNAKWKKIKNKEKNYVQKKCLQCGKKMDVLKTRVNDSHGKFCSKKCYTEWEKHLFGDCPAELERIRGLSVYRTWRKIVLVKDKHKCQDCGLENCLLEADHIIPLVQLLVENKIKTLDAARRCDVLWDIDNGQALCRKCHHRKTARERKLINKYGLFFSNLSK